jgi:CBS-domain-containing membrane protein
MKVHDLMTREVKSCDVDTNLAAAAALMWAGDCGALPVVKEGRVVGIITDRDIALAVGTRRRIAEEIPVREAMSGDVFACSPEEDIHSALKTMRRDRVRRLPVINDHGELEGILSMNDVALHAEKVDGAKPSRLSYDDVVNTFKAICEHRHPKSLSRRAAASL